MTIDCKLYLLRDFYKHVLMILFKNAIYMYMYNYNNGLCISLCIHCYNNMIIASTESSTATWACALNTQSSLCHDEIEIRSSGN